MKSSLISLAVLAAITTPAFAQKSASHDYAGIFHWDGYRSVTTGRAGMNAYARAYARNTFSPRFSYEVRDAAGNLIGADPDANVRLQLQRDDVSSF